MVTVAGVALADGTVTQPFIEGGVPVYRRFVGSGFFLFVEMERPADLLPIGTVVFQPGGLPDFRIAVDRAIGDGSPAVCDDGPVPEPAGGVPALPGADFGANPNTVNDFSCRFEVRTAVGTGPCTRDGFGNDAFVSTDSEVQFCALIGVELAFPVGDTRVTVAGTDVLGRPGAPTSIIIRVTPP